MNIDTRKGALFSAVLAILMVFSFGFYNVMVNGQRNTANNSTSYDAVSNLEPKLVAEIYKEPEALQAPSASEVKEEVRAAENVDTSIESPAAQPAPTQSVQRTIVGPTVKVAVSKTISEAAKKSEPVKVASRGASTAPAALKKSTVAPTTAKAAEKSGEALEAAAKVSEKGTEVVEAAKKYLGKPYVYGGASPSGFDCSGLTMYVFAKFNVSLPHTAMGQASRGQYIPKNQLKPGDLVFFTTNGTGTISHVGIYTGGGSFIHSPVPGKVVSFASMGSGYYSSRYITARRISF